ncbi:hypothetical protein GGQ68_001461 [Sagittula marina]|uniref:Uncharacterized protein n=1 Tax=Sagittula marina TaxID=943940 RepID=A0A7W6DLQ2_9RHOB|nr:hypothetical protein [Sagittula marina]
MSIPQASRCAKVRPTKAAHFRYTAKQNARPLRVVRVIQIQRRKEAVAQLSQWVIKDTPSACNASQMRASRL